MPLCFSAKRYFFDVNILLGSGVTRLKCGEIFSD